MPIIDQNNNNTEASNFSVDNQAKTPDPVEAGKVLTYLSFILIIPIFLYVHTRNKLVKLQIKVNEVASGIDIQLAKRRDTLTKLVDATKGSMDFEKDLLLKVTEMRKMNPGNIDRQTVDQKQQVVSGRLLATLEAYPDIKSTQNVAKILDSAENIELEIAASRRLYNSYVNDFNSSLFTWPGSVIANAMKLTTFQMFKASVKQKEDVEIKF